MTNSVYRGRYPKLERRDNPPQLQGRMELNTDRDGEADNEMNSLQISVKFIFLGEIGIYRYGKANVSCRQHTLKNYHYQPIVITCVPTV